MKLRNSMFQQVNWVTTLKYLSLNLVFYFFVRRPTQETLTSVFIAIDTLLNHISRKAVPLAFAFFVKL